MPHLFIVYPYLFIFILLFTYIFYHFFIFLVASLVPSLLIIYSLADVFLWQTIVISGVKRP